MGLISDEEINAAEAYFAPHIPAKKLLLEFLEEFQKGDKEADSQHSPLPLGYAHPKTERHLIKGLAVAKKIFDAKKGSGCGLTDVETVRQVGWALGFITGALKFDYDILLIHCYDNTRPVFISIKEANNKVILNFIIIRMERLFSKEFKRLEGGQFLDRLTNHLEGLMTVIR